MLTNLANHWAAHGDAVTVLTLATEQNDAYRLHPKVSRVALQLAQPSTSSMSAVVNNLRRGYILRQRLLQLRPDVAISFTTSANVLLACASILAPWVAMGSEHNWPARSTVSRTWKLLRRYVYSQLAAVTCLTPAMAAWLQANTGARFTPVMPNPVWPIVAGPQVLDPASIVPVDNKLLLAAGRLAKQKGFDMLIDVFVDIAQRHGDWTLVILGEGNERAALQEQILRRDLSGRVLLPGVAGNIVDWYRRADLYVMSSRFEGFGNTLAEALACGTPAVSFDCATGPATIIRHGVDGLLAPAEDVAALRAALDRLMSDEGLRREFAARAIEAREFFSIEAVAQQWNVVLDDLLRARRHSGQR